MRRVPAILMVIFLVCPFFFAALMTISISTWALDRGFYIRLIDDERLYQIPDVVSTDAGWHTDVPALDALSFRFSGRAAREILPPSYLRVQALRVLNQAFDYLQRPTEGFDVSLDLAPVKANLLGEPGKRFAKTLAQDLPVGGASADFLIAPGILPRFRPASVSVDRAAAIIEAGLPTFVKSIPDIVRLSDNPYYHPAYAAWGWGPGFSVYGAFIVADIVLLFIAGGLWTAAAFVGGANRFERLQWFGWSLFAPAVAVFLIGLFTVVGFFSGWAQYGIETATLANAVFDPSVRTALVDLVARATSRVGTGFIATGAIAGGVAMGLLAWSWSLSRDKEKEANA